jgi:hypothetical protein
VAPHGRADHGIRALMTAGLTAVVGAIVLGILGMHAFAHDPTPMTGASDHVATATHDQSRGHDMRAMAGSSSTATMSRDVPDTTSPRSASSSQEVAGNRPAPAHSMGDMVMLCAAMLLAVAAGTLLALRLRQHIPSIPISIRPRPRSRTFPVTARVGIGPPAEWKFSVVRC